MSFTKIISLVKQISQIVSTGSWSFKREDIINHNIQFPFMDRQWGVNDKCGWFVVVFLFGIFSGLTASKGCGWHMWHQPTCFPALPQLTATAPTIPHSQQLPTLPSHLNCPRTNCSYPGCSAEVMFPNSQKSLRNLTPTAPIKLLLVPNCCNGAQQLGTHTSYTTHTLHQINGQIINL